MEAEILTPLGARVRGLDAAVITADETEQLRALLGDHGVLHLPEQELDDAAFVDFLKGFGPMAFTKGEAHADGFLDLNVVTNVGRTTTPKSNWHVDTSYVKEPPAYTALRAVEVPEQGGETLFTNQYRALETLPGPLRAELDGRTLLHVVTGVELEDGDEAEAEHPLFRPHPLTGRPALYLTSPARCAAISGMGAGESAETIATLLAHSTDEENTYRHAWAPGDVIMWDNACVLHKADHTGVSGDRTMHRGMVASHRG